MERKRRRMLVLTGAALAVFVGAIWARERLGSSGAGNPTSSGQADLATARSESSASPQDTVVNVNIGALDLPRPEPVEATRNPFVFRPKVSPRPPVLPGPDTRANGPAPAAPRPAGPPPLPPIALKFIGVVDAAGPVGKLAVLSDGRAVYHGREGDVIDGRYRIIRIATESIELAYADGRGRQTVRLTGQ